MSRRPREDEPGSWHHVMNRGIARRTLFETERDIRFFLSRLAWAVHGGDLEVHAYVVMTTHFHVLVRSLRERLSESMQYIQAEFARWFNRSRRRDGALHRGRFTSKPCRSLAYRHILVRYIDSNPVDAGLCTTSVQYPHGSARWYARQGGPIWLARGWVEEEVREVSRCPVYDPAQYAEVFAPAPSQSLAKLVERRTKPRYQGEDPLDELLGAAPERVLAWMRRKAALADGTGIGLPVATPEDVLAAIEQDRAMLERMRVRSGQKEARALPLVRVALLRELCGVTLAEAGLHVGIATSGAAKLHERHRRLMESDPSYASQLAALTRKALENCHAARIVENRV